MIRSCWFGVVGVLCSIGLLGEAGADPCGMVPPVYTGQGAAITRVGPQKTYVFYKNGVESFVIRPGFSGKVEHFGMLIPFPTPPAIRKVPDNIFSHVKAAIDPPEVRVYIRRYYRKYRMRSSRGMPSPPAKKAAVAKDSIRVLRQEAVGMYEVAVLEAGSPKALKRWMKRHGYRYPKGMDGVCYDYIKKGWCFVAVKTRVSEKSTVSPRPGMRRARRHFPAGGSFNGKVQAMGFRFKTKKLVVPMRLSAFNAGRLRNIVYLLTEGPRKIRSIPAEYVMRQVNGLTLYGNVTQPLPLRIIGGTLKDVKPYQWNWIHRQRNPVRVNGLARNMFASDLLAVRTKKLSLDHEEEKKALLDIGESLKLRGGGIDRLNRQALKESLQRTVRRGLRDLKKMTLTVVDGDFPREVIARENLTFAYFKMPRKKNHNLHYNARFMRKGYKQGGTLTRARTPKKYVPKIAKPRVESLKSPVKRGTSRQFMRWIVQLGKRKTSKKALRSLVRNGQAAVPYLMGEAIEGNSFVRRGWSIVGLARIGGPKVESFLLTLQQDARVPKLVRTWSFAARVSLTHNFDALMKMFSQAYSFPGAQRPVRLKATSILQRKKRCHWSSFWSFLHVYTSFVERLLDRSRREEPNHSFV